MEAKFNFFLNGDAVTPCKINVNLARPLFFFLFLPERNVRLDSPRFLSNVLLWPDSALHIL